MSNILLKWAASIKRMSMKTDLPRYLTAQERDYTLALAEIRAGRKQSHWMWYIFPQVKGLGESLTSRKYAIQSLQETVDYLNHPVLGSGLREISRELLLLETRNVGSVFGITDSLKLKSCMTLFSAIDISKEKCFQRVLDEFFNGKVDERTMDQVRVWQEANDCHKNPAVAWTPVTMKILITRNA
jgi:uncharacterized protein (DUF1810 family)